MTKHNSCDCMCHDHESDITFANQCNKCDCYRVIET